MPKISEKAENRQNSRKYCRRKLLKIGGKHLGPVQLRKAVKSTRNWTKLLEFTEKIAS